MAELIFTRNFDRPDSHALGVYRETGGYTALPKALAMEPTAIT
jgi:NADH-quinone oxidoreductase subunit F